MLDVRELKERGASLIAEHIYGPLRWSIVIAALVILCMLTSALFIFLSLTSNAQYEIKNFSVSQNKICLHAQWNEAGASRYRLFVFSRNEKPITQRVATPVCQIPLKTLGKKYLVILVAENDHGGLSAAVAGTLLTRKLNPRIATEEEKYKGIAGKFRPLQASAPGNLSYQSEDPSVVSVTRDGILRYREDGKTNIIIHSRATSQYNSGQKKVAVRVFPNKLETPDVKVKNISDITAKISWDKVQYADKYTLYRKNPVSSKFEKIDEFKDGNKRSAEFLRDEAEYKVKAAAKIEGEKITSDISDEAKIRSTADTAETYDSSHNLKTLDYSNLTLVTKIDGKGRASVPQSMSHVGEDYVVTFVDMGGKVGAFCAYSNTGQGKGSRSINGMGHANGSTYNPLTGEILTVKTHKQIKSALCTAFDMQADRSRDFTLPKLCSGIAYDESNNKFYLSKGNELYVTDTDFNVEKFLWKKIRYNHAQDIGAYNGVIMACTWVHGNESYIDMYRSEDGEYLGSYYVPIGEIESCFVDNKELIILMNNSTKYGDCILKTEPISIP